jgi:hypothetical protein
MKIEIKMNENKKETEEWTNYAGLAAIMCHYRNTGRLNPLENLDGVMQKRKFSVSDKLTQVLMSILMGCENLAEAKIVFPRSQKIAQVMGWEGFSDPSNLSRTLDVLTLKQIEQLRQNTTAIGRQESQIRQRDWRKFLWLDFDLTGLPCAAKAEASQKGYFSEKKHYGSPTSQSECH